MKITSPAQPVEAVEVTEEMAWEACHIFYGRRHGHAEGSKDRMKKFLEVLRDHPALIPALAHPRPTGDGMVPVVAEDANNYCRILTALGMEEEGDPVAEVERLMGIANAAPTVEQAGEVVAFRIVGRHGPYPWVDGKPDPEPEFIVGEGERLELAYGQPCPMSLPDGWKPVPVDPDEAMEEAMAMAYTGSIGGYECAQARKALVAAIDAAPALPKAGPA